MAHEAHELAHTPGVRLACGRWAQRNFNCWSIHDRASGCHQDPYWAQGSIRVEAKALQPGVQAGDRRTGSAVEVELPPGRPGGRRQSEYADRWVREAEAGDGKAFPGSGTPRGEELARLKRELTRVTKEWVFLRDAAAYFAQQSPNGTQ